MTIKIEKNVPIPAARGGRTAKCRYPFDEMDVGDSFVVSVSDFSSPAYAQARLCWVARRKGVKVATRVLGDQVRVWRIA